MISCLSWLGRTILRRTPRLWAHLLHNIELAHPYDHNARARAQAWIEDN